MSLAIVLLLTLAAFLNHDMVSNNTIANDISAASAHITALDTQNIDLNMLGEHLQQKDLAQFATAFGKLLELTA